VVLFPVQKPVWDLELSWIPHNHHKILKLCSTQLSSTFTHVYVCLLANKVRKSSPHSLDGGQGKHDLLSSINIGIEHTQNMLKILICNERHSGDVLLQLR
jgi:hypothetical protein